MLKCKSHLVSAVAAGFVFFGMNAAYAASSDDYSGKVTVLNGHEVSLFGHSDLNPDCTKFGYSTITSVVRPSHGTIRMAHQKIFAVFGATNPRYQCNTKGGPGIRVYYRANKGYHGSDHAVFSVYSAYGRKGTATIDINVD